MQQLLSEIRACTLCRDSLPHGPRPVVAAAGDSRILIIGQAPGQKVHDSGIPWNDKSGDELRRWVAVDKGLFYDTSVVGLVPMGFCYPGKGASGDLPPRPECAPASHSRLLSGMKEVQLIILVGSYAQKYYLADKALPTLTENVKQYSSFLPRFFPLVHPSPRNKIWMKKNPWFEAEVIPQLRNRVKDIIM